jgi:hypothetical protein
MPDLIIFNCIAANNLNKNAAIFVGDNSASGWDSNNKNENVINQTVGAANVFTAILTMLNDNDIVDTPIVDTDVESAPAVQA